MGPDSFFPNSSPTLPTLLMSDISPALVKALREKTNAGMMDCKKALVETSGDMDKAEDLLRKKGIASAAKRTGRAAKEGVIEAYIHLQGKLGVLVEVNCETDFVAKNGAFRGLVKDIAMHIAAAHPLHVSREEVPAALVEREKEIYRGQVANKPPQIVEKIVEGKVDKFYSGICLLEQAFIKNPDLTIKELVASKITELGENIVIRRFARFMVGEQIEGESEAPTEA